MAEASLSTATLGLQNGGSAGFLYTNLATWIGFLAVYASMGELGSMAPTSGISSTFWIRERGLIDLRWTIPLSLIHI